jgi:hypothetical protein
MHLLLALLLAANPAQLARQWRAAHEKEIVAELSAFVAIPNLASDKANIERNAAFLAEAFTRRGAKVRLLRVEGAPPLVVADFSTNRTNSTKRTITFYAHYDGQPVDPAQWSTPPWEPVLKGSGPRGAALRAQLERRQGADRRHARRPRCAPRRERPAVGQSQVRLRGRRRSRLAAPRQLYQPLP